MALALFIAPWGFVIANALYLWTTLHGGDDLTSRNALALAAAHPLADRLGILAAMLGSLLFVPAVLGAMRLVRVRAAWLGLIGGVLMIAAYICYFGLVFQSLTTNAMARQGGPVSAYVAVLDAVSNEPLTAWVGPLFIFGNIVGTFLLGLALLRARAVPAWAAYAVMAWSVLHVVGIAFGSEGFEVTGAILQGLGLAAVGIRLLRQPLPQDPQPGEVPALDRPAPADPRPPRLLRHLGLRDLGVKQAQEWLGHSDPATTLRHNVRLHDRRAGEGRRRARRGDAGGARGRRGEGGRAFAAGARQRRGARQPPLTTRSASQPKASPVLRENSEARRW